MHRLPPFCPANNLKAGEVLVCPRMDATGCRDCMDNYVDEATH